MTIINRMINRLCTKHPLQIFYNTQELHRGTEIWGESYVYIHTNLILKGTTVLSPAYLRHVSPTRLQNRYFFDVGMVRVQNALMWF